MLNRECCIICGGPFRCLSLFEEFPVYMGVSDSPDLTDDLFLDMSWVICTSCGCIQLKELVDLSILYHKGHNSAYGRTWEKHHKQLSSFVKKYCGSSILEIGGGNLKLAEFVTDDNDIKFTVFDNNCNESTRKNIITKEEFFDYTNYSLDYEIDTIVHSHVLEHLYDPIEYMKIFSKILKDGQRMIMSVPLLDEMVKDNFTNSINFEHTYMISEKLLHFIIGLAGFKVIDSERFNPYNIFIVCEKISDSFEVVLDNEYEKNLHIFYEFFEFHLDLIEKINSMEGDNFYIFGGHIFTQYLFMFGLDQDKFNCILDNDPNKIGNRLYGTELIVKSPKILADIEKPVVVLRAAQFSKEIKEDILKNINNKTYFIEE